MRRDLQAMGHERDACILILDARPEPPGHLHQGSAIQL